MWQNVMHTYRGGQYTVKLDTITMVSHSHMTDDTPLQITTTRCIVFQLFWTHLWVCCILPIPSLRKNTIFNTWVPHPIPCNVLHSTNDPKKHVCVVLALCGIIFHQFCMKNSLLCMQLQVVSSTIWPTFGCAKLKVSALGSCSISGSFAVFTFQLLVLVGTISMKFVQSVSTTWPRDHVIAIYIWCFLSDFVFGPFEFRRDLDFVFSAVTVDQKVKSHFIISIAVTPATSTSPATKIFFPLLFGSARPS